VQFRTPEKTWVFVFANGGSIATNIRSEGGKREISDRYAIGPSDVRGLLPRGSGAECGIEALQVIA
jgi:hypothetical protein